MKFNLKNKPSLNSERFKEFSIDTYEDQANKYLTFIAEEEKWFEGFEKELREKYKRKEFFSIARWDLVKEILGEQ